MSLALTDQIAKLKHDHSQILDRLEEVSGSYGSNRSVLISEIVEHLTTHFAEEELCMKQAGYPLLDAHKLAHNDIQNMLVAIFMSSIPAEHQDLTEIKDEILNHTEIEDECFFQFLLG